MSPTIEAEIEELREARARLVERGEFAPITLQGYAYDWAGFAAWCEARGRGSLPASADTLSLYLTALLGQGLKVTTVRRRCCAVVHRHRMAGLSSPAGKEVLALLAGAQRERAEKPRQMRPLTIAQLREISEFLGEQRSTAAIRDRAILVVGFASALRRSSIAGLNLADVEFCTEGMVIHVGREKQDQTGRGRLIGIPWGRHEATCAVRCLRAWIERRGERPGPLFWRLQGSAGLRLDGECVERLVKRCVAIIGLDPRDRFAAHSLRSGFVTAAGEGGAGELLIAAQTGHRSMDVLRRYFRRSDLFRANACNAIEL
jgi:site-specific recombinase XerD